MEDLNSLYDNSIYPGIYGLTTYGFTALYESSIIITDTLNSSATISWIATGDTGDILFTYRTKSYSSISWGDWATTTDAIGIKSSYIVAECIQYAFIFLAPHWSDTDSVIVTSII